MRIQQIMALHSSKYPITVRRLNPGEDNSHVRLFYFTLRPGFLKPSET